MSWGACYRLAVIALFQEAMQAVRQDPEEVPSDTVPKTRFGARGFILGVTRRYTEQCRRARRALVPTLAGTLVLWYSGTLVLWYSGTLVLWYSGTGVRTQLVPLGWR